MQLVSSILCKSSLSETLTVVHGVSELYTFLMFNRNILLNEIAARVITEFYLLFEFGFEHLKKNHQKYVYKWPKIFFKNDKNPVFLHE